MPRKKQTKPTITPTDLLLSTLPFVADLGFSHEALTKGAESLGLSESEATHLFPDLPSDLINAFSAWADAEMERTCPESSLSSLKVREKIAALVTARLSALEPYKKAEAQAVRTLAHPRRVVLATRLLQHTADLIWTRAGDTSTDYNFYTKRILLGGVYSSTLLFWLKDETKNHDATQKFLANRIENVLTFGRTQKKIISTAGAATRFIAERLGLACPGA